MTHQDKISIFITFMVGVALGGYLYLTGFATTFSLPEVGKEDVYDELVITADSYGQCVTDGNCLSFQVLGDGTYRAVYDSTGRKFVKEGSIPSILRQKLTATLTEYLLAPDAELLANPTCAYGELATNYRFKVSLDRQDYVLDTCLTQIDYEGQAWAVLSELWKHLVTP